MLVSSKHFCIWMGKHSNKDAVRVREREAKKPSIQSWAKDVKNQSQDLVKKREEFL